MLVVPAFLHRWVGGVAALDARHDRDITSHLSHVFYTLREPQLGLIITSKH